MITSYFGDTATQEDFRLLVRPNGAIPAAMPSELCAAAFAPFLGAFPPR